MAASTSFSALGLTHPVMPYTHSLSHPSRLAVMPRTPATIIVSRHVLRAYTPRRPFASLICIAPGDGPSTDQQRPRWRRRACPLLPQFLHPPYLASAHQGPGIASSRAIGSSQRNPSTEREARSSSPVCPVVMDTERKANAPSPPGSRAEAVK